MFSRIEGDFEVPACMAFGLGVKAILLNRRQNAGTLRRI